MADDSEVLFDQPEESAGALELEGSSWNRHKKETGFEETEPHRGARPRKMDFDQPVDDERGATSGRGGGRRYFPGGGIRGYCVSDAKRSGGITVGKPVSEDAEGNKTRARVDWQTTGSFRPHILHHTGVV